MPLAELGAVGREYDGQMGEGGRVPTERGVQAEVARDAGHPLLPARDVGYAHEVVVYDGR